MLTIRDAKPLFALTVLLVPWDYFNFGGDIGWGLHFALFRFHDATTDTGYFTLLELFQLRSAFGSSARIGLFLWGIAGTVTVLCVVYVVIARLLGGTTDRREDRIIGAILVLAGVLFLLRGVFTYDYLVFDSATRYSVPFGAVYTMFVGFVFYRDLFRVGA